MESYNACLRNVVHPCLECHMGEFYHKCHKKVYKADFALILQTSEHF